MPEMKLVVITADPGLARRAQDAGVGRIKVDIERMGKFERQKCRDTWISKHKLEDVGPVVASVDQADVMVRINPLYDGTQREIDRAIAEGAQAIMLPMFDNASQVARVGAMIAGRCAFVPLVETGAAFSEIQRVAQLPEVTEVFVGLNDLHLSLGLDFMFEPLANGMLDQACEALRAIGKPFGFGGIARIGEGDLSAELIMAKHAHLGSTRVNLSRTFARAGENGSSGTDGDVLAPEVDRLLATYRAALVHSDQQRAEIDRRVRKQIARAVERIRARTP